MGPRAEWQGFGTTVLCGLYERSTAGSTPMRQRDAAPFLWAPLKGPIDRDQVPGA